MSDIVIVALIAAMPGLLTVVLQMMNRRVALETKAKVIETHDLTNSKMTQLIEAEKGKALSEGREQGQDKERIIQSSPVAVPPEQGI